MELRCLPQLCKVGYPYSSALVLRGATLRVSIGELHCLLKPSTSSVSVLCPPVTDPIASRRIASYMCYVLQWSGLLANIAQRTHLTREETTYLLWWLL